jgi:VWFA-related protein
MFFARPYAVLLGLATVAIAQEPAPRAQTPTFPSDVEMVVVDVVVTGKQGGPLAGLRGEDFTVTEDGAPQVVATFEAVDVTASPAEEPAEPRPKVSVNTGLQAMNSRSFIIIVDQIHLSAVGAARARAAIAEFLRFGPRPGDTVMVVGTAGGTWWMTRAEEGKDELNAVLDRLKGRSTTNDTPDRITDWEAMRIWEDRDPIALEQVRRRFESYVTGKSRSAEGLPIRGQDRLTDLGSGKEWATDTEVLNRAQEVYRQSVVRNRTTLTALGRVLDSLGAVRGRKTVILLSEGFIRDTRLDEYNAVIRSAQRSNAAIYFVDVRGLTAMPAAASAQFGPLLPAADVAEQVTQDLVSAEGSDTLANSTGGFSIKSTNDLERGLLRVSQEARRYYLLGYAPANTRRDGRWRKISVKVNRPDIDVRARQGYYAPGGKKDAEEASGAWRPGLQQALDSPYEFKGIPVRMTDHVFGEAGPGKARTLVTAEVDIRGLAYGEEDGRFVDTLECLLVVVHRESGEFQRHDQKLELKLPREVRDSLERRWLPVSREFELVPGAHRAKLVVRDKRGGTLGSVSHELEVPDLRAWRISTPVLSDALEPKKEGAPLRPVIPARRTFMADGTLYFQFEVYGSAADPASGLPRVTSGFSLRTGGGTVVTQGPSAPIRPTPEGRLARIGVIPLEGLRPGRYELVLDLRDEVAGRTMEVREAFSIEPPAIASVSTPGS